MYKFLATFLVICFTLIIFDVTAEIFGCPFINDKTFLLSEKPSTKPVYGNILNPLQLDTEQELIQLVNEVRRLNKDMLQFTVYNSVDNILELYAYWKNVRNTKKSNTSKSFPLIFKEYRPSSTSLLKSPSVGTPINIASLIAFINQEKVWKKIKDSIFLAAVQVDVNMKENDLKNINFETYIKSEAGKYIDRTIAVVKFRLVDRTGFLFVDPSSNLEEPVVLMEDGNEPNWNNIVSIKGKNMCPLVRKKSLRSNPVMSSFNFKNVPERDLITPEKKKVYKVLENNPNFSTVRFSTSKPKPGWNSFEELIMVGKPFCSYVDIPEKRNLLERDRYLVMTNNCGYPLGGLALSVVPKSIKQDSEMVKASKTLKIFLNNNKADSLLKHQILYSRINQNKTLSQCLSTEEMELVTKLNKLLNFHENVLNDKIKQIARMMSDEEFVKEIYDYSKMLSLTKSTAAIKPTFSEYALEVIQNIFLCNSCTIL